MIPEPWEFALLAMAAFRVTHLLADDSIIDRQRDWAVSRLGDRFDELITCYWCAGWWVCVAWWSAWLLEDRWTLTIAALWSLSAVVGLAGSVWQRLSN